MTLTTATATRAAGTFSFTALEAAGVPGVTVRKVVTNGSFDVTF